MKWVVDYKARSIYTLEYTLHSTVIEALTKSEALMRALEMGLKDPDVKGICLMEIPTKEDGITPDWNNAKDYDAEQNN